MQTAEELSENTPESKEYAEKICPFLNQYRSTSKANEMRTCIGKKCACYVRIWKPLMLTNVVKDPVNIMIFEGCGLIFTPPWRVERKTKKGETL
jgi:hypothetical protein